MNVELIRIIDYYIGIILVQFLRVSRLIKSKKLTRGHLKPKKILLIKFFGFGNLIFSSPTLYSIRKQFPDADVHVLTLNKNEGILECYKEYVTKPVYFDMGGLKLPITTLKLLKTLRKEKYDVLIDLDHFSRYAAIIAFLANSKVTIGYKSKGAKKHYLYDFIVTYKGDKHIAEEFLNLLQPLDIKPEGKIKLLPLKTGEAEKNRVENWIEINHLKNKKIVGIHTEVNYNHLQRNWPYFEKLIERLLKETDVSTVLTAGPQDYRKCEDIIKNVNHDYEVKKERIKIAKGIKLNELGYLIKKFDLFISNDTGPLHMAAAQDLNVISFYGPYTPRLYGPYTKKRQIFYKPPFCSPCMTNFNDKKAGCNNPICIKSISIDEVFEAVKKFLYKPKSI